MSGPWERYKTAAPPAQDGPWTRYAPAAKPKPSVADEAPFSSTEGESAIDLALAGAGKSFVDTGVGMAQRVSDLLRYQTMGMVPSLERGGQQIQQAIDKQRETDAPLMQTLPGMAGNIGGQVAQSAILPGGAAKTLGTKLLQAGVQQAGFAASQPVASDETLAGNVAWGGALGALGQGVASGLGRVAKGLSDKIDPAKLALIEKAREAGIPVNAAQISDSRFMKTLASVVNKLPFSGGDKAAKAQGTAFTRAAAKTIGEDAEALSETVMQSAKSRIKKSMDELAETSGVKVDDKLLGEFDRIVSEAKRYTPDGAGSAVGNIAADLVGKAENGVIPGQAYQAFATRLRELSKTPGNHYMGQLRTALEDALDRSIPKASKAAWASAREQYRSLKVLEKLVAKNGGSVPPAQLLAKLNTGKNTTAYGGGGRLAELGRIGHEVLRDPIPNSGTAERVTATGVGGGGYLFGVSPTNLAMGMGIGATLGRGLNSDLFSKYLTHGMGPVGRGFLGSGRLAPHAFPAVQRTAEERARGRKGLLSN